MTSKAVTVPLPENLPFINDWFIKSAQKAEDDQHEMYELIWPGMIGHDLIRAIKKFTPATFTAFFEVLTPTIFDKPIVTLDDLAYVANEEYEYYRNECVENEAPSDFSREELQVWLLSSSALFPKDIDWRKVATLYNGSPDDQRQAINDFLWEFRRLEIHTLLDQKGMDLPIPESLRSNKSRSVDGEEQLFCEMTQQWLRDDVFHTRFKISYSEGFTDSGPIGYAGTLHQAIAKAIVRAQSQDGAVDVPGNGMKRLMAEINQSMQNGKMTIHFEKELVAEAELTRAYVKDPDSQTIQKAKLSWGDAKSASFSQQSLRKALWSTEKLFGLQWSKVRHLEDDLGM